MDTKFSMYVLSNGSQQYYPNNTLSNFSVKLPFSLELPTSLNEKWGIAIQGVGLSSNFKADYTEENPMPLMIEMLSYIDYELCVQLNPIETEKCDKFVKSRNRDLKTHTNYCFNDELKKDSCNLMPNIKKQLEEWARVRIKTEAMLRPDGPEEKSLIYNFYFNSLKNNFSMEKLITRLEYNYLHVDRINLTKISIRNVTGFDVERILLLRHDIYKQSLIEQDINYIEETNVIDDLELTHLLFGMYNARLINGNTLVLNNTLYKVFVLNQEFTKLYIDFTSYIEKQLFTPNIIKIKCDNIRSQIFNNQHSNDIEVIKPIFSKTENHHFHEFENPIYVPLLNTRLRDLTFQLTDEYNNQLVLSEGLPTLLQVSFKRMGNNDKSFSIRLTPVKSNSENTISNFENILPATLNFNENWRVGLKEITFPTKIKSLPNDDNHLSFIETDEKFKILPKTKISCHIVNECFDQESLVKVLNDFSSLSSLIYFSITDNCLYINSKKNCVIRLSHNLAKFFNVPNIDLSYTFKHKDVHLKKNTNTKIGNSINWYLFRPAYLMIYSDLVKPSLISSEYTNILRIVPVKKEDEIEYQSVEFKNVEFREIANNFVNIINIQIRSHSGELVAFHSNFLSLHLYFTNHPFRKDF